MKKTLLLLAVLLGFFAADAQVVIPRTEIPYNVKYHWGLIDVMIARGKVVMESDGQQFYGTLDGTSIPWEGRIICVSDTLNAQMHSEGGNMHENVAYQSGWYRHPQVNSFRSATYNPDDPAFFKNISGQGDYDASGDTMEAITVTSDMIGMYYFAKAIDFEALEPGTRLEVPIDGPYSKMLAITYNGKGTFDANGDTYPTYDCTFEYDYGGTMSGYPVECKISATERIPVFLGASLPLGQVQMLYDPY